MQNLILRGVIRGIFKIQGCYVPQKSIFDLFDKELPARMVTVKVIHRRSRIKGSLPLARVNGSITGYR